MKESNLKLAQKDIDEALKAVEEMESYINEGKEKFDYFTRNMGI